MLSSLHFWNINLDYFFNLQVNHHHFLTFFCIIKAKQQRLMSDTDVLFLMHELYAFKYDE